MADQALEKAMAMREELAAKINAAQQQIDGWRRELSEAEAFINQWHRFAGTKSPLLPKPPALDLGSLQSGSAQMGGTVTVHPAPKKKATTNSKKEDVSAEVRRIIEEQNRVMPRKELLPELRNRGYVIEGGDPDMVLSTMLWRAGEAAGVVRIGRGGYWRTDLPSPDGLWNPQVGGHAYRGEPHREALFADGYSEQEIDGDAEEPSND